VGLVWFIATGIFAILYFISAIENYAFLAFVVAPFVSSIVLVVFSAMWGNRLLSALSCSLLLWTLVIMLHVIIMTFAAAVADKLYLLYVVAVPFQILIVLWFVLRKVKHS
jgi:hypothetical protein